MRLQLFLLVATLAASPAAAQIVVVDRGDRALTLDGVIQPQFVRIQHEADKPADQISFRRLILEAQATISTAWTATMQVDFGQSSVLVRNAYVQYTGWRSRGLTLTIGNQKLPFSRTFINSGVKRDLPERPFTGDRNYGTPSRALGLKLDGAHRRRTIQWAAGVGGASVSPAPSTISFDSPLTDAGNAGEGLVLAGRTEWHPAGEMTREQGDFHTTHWKSAIAIASYRWWNHGDRGASTGGAAHAAGLEVSGGIRGHGVTADAEFERIHAASILPTLTDGVYRAGVAGLRKASLEGGYMIVNHRIELTAAVDMLDAATYSKVWRRASAGTVVYLHDQRAKLEIAQRIHTHVRGRPGTQHETFAQIQVLF